MGIEIPGGRVLLHHVHGLAPITEGCTMCRTPIGVVNLGIKADEVCLSMFSKPYSECGKVMMLKGNLCPACKTGLVSRDETFVLTEQNEYAVVGSHIVASVYGTKKAKAMVGCVVKVTPENLAKLRQEAVEFTKAIIHRLGITNAEELAQVSPERMRAAVAEALGRKIPPETENPQEGPQEVQEQPSEEGTCSSSIETT